MTLFSIKYLYKQNEWLLIFAFIIQNPEAGVQLDNAWVKMASEWLCSDLLRKLNMCLTVYSLIHDVILWNIYSLKLNFLFQGEFMTIDHKALVWHSSDPDSGRSDTLKS